MMPVQGAGGGGFGSRQGDTEILMLREVLRDVWGCEFKFEFCWLW